MQTSTQVGVTLDYGSAAFREDSVRLLAEACAAAPVARILPRGVVGILRFADVDAALRDPGTFSSRVDLVPQPEGTARLGALIGDDPPDHTRLRALLGQVFLPARVAGMMEPRVLGIARDLVAEVLDSGRDFDLARDIGGPFPVRVIAELLGVDAADMDRFHHWSHDVTAAEFTLALPDSPEKARRMAEITQSLRELDAHLAAVVAEHRKKPAENLISFMIQSAEGGERLSDEEILGLSKLLLVAGNETTTRTIGLFMNQLLRNPPAWEELRASPGLLPNAIEESVRLEGPVYHRLRRTTRDVTVLGVPVARGALVDCVLGAANLDATVFPDPTRFDMRRPIRRHLGFGGGIHQCLGAPLARLELRILFEELLERMEEVRLVGQPVRDRTGAFRAFETLPLAFKPARAVPVSPAADMTTAEGLLRRTDHELGLDKRAREIVRVARVRDIAEGIKLFRLVHPKGGLLTRFSPGSHLVVHLSDGKRVWRNAYSLLNTEFGNGLNYFIAVKLEPGGRGGSRYLHEHVHPGMELEVSVPANNFPPAPSAPGNLLVAGGIGITPLFALRNHLRATGQPCELHYAFRAARAAAFVEELLVEADERVRFYDESAGERLDADALVRAQRDGTHVYVCGPPGLMDAVIEAAQRHGWPPERVHYERFGAAPTRNESPFEARCERRGRTVTCGGDESLLEALEREGVEVPYACRAGSCGACVTTVLAGEVDHRDTLLSDAERAQGQMLVCVSRGRTRLVLGL